MKIYFDILSGKKKFQKHIRYNIILFKSYPKQMLYIKLTLVISDDEIKCNLYFYLSVF